MIDNSYRSLLEEMAAGGVPPRHSLSVQGSRQILEDDLVADDGPTVAATTDLSIPGDGDGIPIRLYRPEGRSPYPVLVYLHGGGWVRGNLDTVDAGCCALANRSGCMVVSVDYRQAPEHPFPAAVKDTYATLEWITQYIDALGGDSDRVGIGGISSGGNLAAVASFMARSSDDITLEYQLLLNPVTDYSFDTESYRRFDRAFWSEVCPENAGGYPLSQEDMMWYWNHYLKDELDGQHPYASPLRMRDLSGVPEAMVVTCDLDPLRDEGKAYADRLEKAGVSVEYQNYEKVFHSFLSKFTELERADEAINDVAANVQSALRR